MTLDADPPNCGRTRDGRALIPQPHGGAIAPFPPGHSSLGGFKRPQREALALLHEGTPVAAQRLLALVNSDDERVAVMAAIQVLDRTLGKPTDMPQQAGGGAGSLDVSVLDADEREELLIHLAGIQRLRALVATRLAAKEAA
jgi:hypothetical protein